MKFAIVGFSLYIMRSMIYSEKIHKAAEIAARSHDGLFRKHPEGIPYFSHLAIVALMLERAGYDDEVVAAGLLHDILEDTDYSEDELRKVFGERVLEIVKGVSEDKSIKDWVERKRLYREMITNGSAEAAAISCADHIHNTRSFAQTMKEGVDIDAVFKVGVSERFRHENELIEIYNKKLGNNPLAQEFADSINDLEKLVKEYV